MQRLGSVRHTAVQWRSGQVVDVATGQGLSDSSGNFGYIPGNIYEVRFCPGAGNCVAVNSCGDYGIASSTGNFGLADPAGCGSNTPCIRDTIENSSSGHCVQINGTLPG